MTSTSICRYWREGLTPGERSDRASERVGALGLMGNASEQRAGTGADGKGNKAYLMKLKL